MVKDSTLMLVAIDTLGSFSLIISMEKERCITSQGKNILEGGRKVLNMDRARLMCLIRLVKSSKKVQNVGGKFFADSLYDFDIS
jgi:hypothetical protein